MLESLLLKNNISRETAELSINFTEQVIGDQRIIDTGRGKRAFVRNVSGGSSSVIEGVVNHPQHGKCYQFNGIGWFSAADGIDFLKNDYELITEFVPANNSTTLEVLFRDRDTADGMQLGIQSNTTNYLQYYHNYSGSAYPYSYGGARATDVLERIEIVRRGSTANIKSIRINKEYTTSVPVGTFKNRMWIGKHQSGDMYNFRGLLKSLKVTLL